jgi:hypothetical protein
MAEPTTNQYFHLLLADIAMAMAISTYDREYAIAARLVDYQPGRLRDDWLAQAHDAELRRSVVALANAGMGSLQRLEDAQLNAAAARFGIPIGPALAQEIATHFEHRRTAVLRYRS